MADQKLRLGVIGTGFISRHFVWELNRRQGYALSNVLTRRPLESCTEFPRRDALTLSLDELIDASDMIFECTGDPAHAAASIEPCLAADKPVVTLDAEFHATLGSYFVDKGLLTEAEGDQPGCLAALREDVVAMGFEPLAYVNMKAFLNRDPTVEDMRFWAEKQQYTMAMVTSFTDGTKVQIEQCLAANGLGAGIAKEELLGTETGDLNQATEELGAAAERLGFPISDYILNRELSHGVFIVGRHDTKQAVPLRNVKFGNGPYYLLDKSFCAVHLEAFKTIERVAAGRGVLLNNSKSPRISVAAVAKRDLKQGETIARGAGSFDLRGICVNITDRPGHLPIYLANDLRISQSIERGQVVTLADVELPDSDAFKIWKTIENKALSQRQELSELRRRSRDIGRNISETAD